MVQPYTLGAATSYAKPLVRTLIHELKFEYMRTAARPLAELLIRYIKKCPPLTEFIKDTEAVILPIPLHVSREKVRGFNQAFNIGTILARHLGIHYYKGVLIKHASTEPQHELTREERLQNIQECFSIQNQKHINGRTVILIDDVVTTGATFAAAAKTVTQYGAKRVYALAVAHTPTSIHSSRDMI